MLPFWVGLCLLTGCAVLVCVWPRAERETRYLEQFLAPRPRPTPTWRFRWPAQERPDSHRMLAAARLGGAQ